MYTVEPKTFFISDMHFDHRGIIRLANRPFADVDDMNAALIERWNAKVSDNDVVWHLGDFAWFNPKDVQRTKNFFDALKGHKRTIIGNHDDPQVLSWFGEVTHYKELVADEKFIVLSHYPIYDWNGRYKGALHFYGHVHNTADNQLPRPNAYNLCVELNNYEPKTVKEIIAS